MIDILYLMAELWGEFCNITLRGHMPRRKKKVFKQRKTGKGIKLRPCHVCGETVNFVLWLDESTKRGRKIYHWANEDGSHHIHAIKELTPEQRHISEIINDN